MPTPALGDLSKFATTKQASAYLGVTPSRIQHMVRDGLLPGSSFVSARLLQVPRSAVEAYGRDQRRRIEMHDAGEPAPRGLLPGGTPTYDWDAPAPPRRAKKVAKKKAAKKSKQSAGKGRR